MNYSRFNNIVRIGSNEKIDTYISAIVVRMSPRIYNRKEHQCIKLQVMDSLLEFCETIIKRVKWVGLVEVARKKKELVNESKGYTLPDAWEITLEKIPPLLLMQDDNEED